MEIIKYFAIPKVTTCVLMLSFGTDTAAPQSFCHSFSALPMIRCSKSAQKSAVQVCQVATVVMETTGGAGSKPIYKFFVIVMEN